MIPATHARRVAIPFAVLFAVYALSLAIRGTIWSGAGIDECFYYAQLASPFWDADLDLTNDLLESRNEFYLRRDLASQFHRGGHVDVAFPVGMAVLNTPAHVAALTVQNLTSADQTPDRYASLFRAMFTLTTWFGVGLGLWCLARTLLRILDPWPAVGFTLAAFLGTNLCYYTWDAAAMAHGLSFAAGAAVLLLALRYQDAPGVKRAAACGLACGVAFLLRWQEGLTAVFVAAAILSSSASARERARDLGVAGFAAILAALPQAVVWYRFYESPFAIPQGSGFFHIEAIRLFRVLFSSLNGWIYSHPLVGGLLALAFIGAWKTRGLALAAMALVAAAWLVNSTAGDWWGGGSFGARRFVGVLPFLLFAAATGWQMVHARARKPLAAMALALVALNVVIVLRIAPTAEFPYTYAHLMADAPLLPQYLAALENWVTSSLFFRGEGEPRSVHLYSLMGVLGIFALGCALTNQRVLRYMIPGGLGLLGAAYLLFLPMAISARAEFPNDNSHWDARYDIARATDMTEAFHAAEEFLKETPRANAPHAQLLLLQKHIYDGHFAEAGALATRMERDLPRTVLEAWVRSAPDVNEERAAWMEKLSNVRLPLGLAPALHQESTLLGLTDEAERWRERLAQRTLQQQMARYDEAAQQGADAHDLEVALRRVLQINPFHVRARAELIRLSPPDVEEHLKVLRRIARRDLAFAATIKEILPLQEDPFHPRWMESFWYAVDAEAGSGDPLLGRQLLAEAIALTLPQEMALAVHQKLKRVKWEEEAAERFEVSAADLLEEDGWGVLEPNEGAPDAFRWNVRRLAFARLPHPLVKGSYEVELQGYRWDGDEFSGEAALDVLGASGIERQALPPHGFTLTFVLDVERNVRRPALRLLLPAFPIQWRDPASRDYRRVGIIFNRLTFTRLTAEENSDGTEKSTP